MVTCSIILPCYNPQAGWAQRVAEQYEAISQRIHVPITLIVVNDGSTTNITGHDITYLENNITAFRYVSYTQNRGKGYALRQGTATADTDYIIYTDIDFPYTVQSVEAIHNALHLSGYDVAAGVKDGEYYNRVPAARRFISKILRAFTGLLLDIPITDTQCGLKGFKSSVKQEFLDIDIDRYLFDLELIRKTAKKGYKLGAVPVTLNDNVVFRRMNYKLLVPEIINLVKIMCRK